MSEAKPGGCNPLLDNDLKGGEPTLLGKRAFGKIVYVWLFLAVFAMSLHGGEETNYLNNASFETINPTTGLPAEWTFIQRGALDKHCELVTSGAFDGSHAVRIFNHDPEMVEGTSFILLQHGVGRRVQFFKESDILEFSVMARAEEKPLELLLYFESSGSRTKYKKFTVQPGEWRKLSFDFSIDGTRYVAGYVGLKLSSLGSVLLDAPALKKASVPINNLIENFSFEKLVDENTPTGWLLRNRSQNGSITVDKTMAADGRNSMRLSSPQAKDGSLLIGCKLTPMILNQIKPGTLMKLALKVNTNGDPGVKFIYYLERFNGGKRLKGAKSPVETSYFGWMDKSFIFEYPDDGPVSEAVVWILLMTSGNLNVDAVVLAQATERDLKASEAVKAVEGSYVRAVGLPSRHTYFVPDAPSRFIFEYKLAASEFTVSLRNMDEGKELGNWTVKNANINAVGKEVITLPSLKEGSYKQEYVWQGGKNQDFFRVRTTQTRGVTFNSDSILLLNGKPFFPIGIYPSVETQNMFEMYHKAGMNTIVLSGVLGEAQAKRYAAVLSPMDMAVVFGSTFCIHQKNKPEAARREVERVLTNAKYFPKLIGVTADELCWGGHSPEDVLLYYETFFRMAPDFLAWQNHAPRLTGSESRNSFNSVRRFTRLSDVTGVDIYPVPGGNAGHNNLPDKSLACVGKYTDLVAQTGWNEVPVWMILQAFSWDEYNGRQATTQPLPTYDELRFMVWNSITHGARGIFYYQPGRLVSVWYGQFGKDISNINRELAAAAEIIINGHSIKLAEAPTGVRFAAFDDGRNRLFVAVNEQKNKSVRCTLPLDGEFYRMPTGKALEGKEFELPPYGVLLLCTSPVEIAPEQGFVYTGLSQESLTINGNWLAHPQFTNAPDKKVFFQQDFKLPELPKGKAILRYCNDDTVEFFINGAKVHGGAGGFRVLTEVEVTGLLKKGDNRISGSLYNGIGPTGVVYEIKAAETLVSSGEETLFSEDGKSNWMKPHVFGKPPVRPWALPHTIERYDATNQN
ncbi:MAG: hypothetical protein J6X55_15430 [Victivallales bacterium]|nr:hypothetical protein [Victivallales bacterium]